MKMSTVKLNYVNVWNETKLFTCLISDCPLGSTDIYTSFLILLEIEVFIDIQLYRDVCIEYEMIDMLLWSSVLTYPHVTISKDVILVWNQSTVIKIIWAVVKTSLFFIVFQDSGVQGGSERAEDSLTIFTSTLFQWYAERVCCVFNEHFSSLGLCCKGSVCLCQ